MTDGSAEIERHYGRGGLLDRILTALKEAGKDIDRLTIDDLSPIDELHSRRRLATKELAAMLAPKPGERLLDIGSGLGGPARYLAKVCGCRAFARTTPTDRSTLPMTSRWRCMTAVSTMG